MWQNGERRARYLRLIVCLQLLLLLRISVGGRCSGGEDWCRRLRSDCSRKGSRGRYEREASASSKAKRARGVFVSCDTRCALGVSVWFRRCSRAK